MISNGINKRLRNTARRKREGGFTLVELLVVLVILVLLASTACSNLRAATANDGLPAGLDKRVLLTTSRVQGSPEPPLMLRAKV